MPNQHQTRDELERADMNSIGELKVEFTLHIDKLNISQYDMVFIGRCLGEVLGAGLLDPKLKGYLEWGIAQGCDEKEL